MNVNQPAGEMVRVQAQELLLPAVAPKERKDRAAACVLPGVREKIPVRLAGNESD